MCRKATCDICKKQTWTGCGSHVPSVIDPIPPSERCDCFPFFKFEGVHYPPKKGDATRLEGSEVKAGGGLKGGSDEEGVGALGWITFAFIIVFIAWAIYNKYYGGGSMTKVDFSGGKGKLRAPGAMMMGGRMGL